MSHFLKIRTQIREREHLVQALRELHYDCQVGENLVVRGYSGNRENAEVLVNTGSQYDIGFQRQGQGQEFECVADWWGVQGNTRLRQQDFIQQVNRQYAYNIIRAQAQEQYLVMEEEERLPNGDTIIVLSERG
jgi:hypothetical protein